MQIRFLVLVLFCALAALPANAQEVLVYEDLQGDTLNSDMGMNRKHYRHPFIGFGFFAGGAGGPSGKIKSAESWAFEYGVRYKRKFNHYLSAGVDWSFSRLQYSPAAWDGPNLADDLPLNSEKLVLVQTGLGLYQRFNWQKRRGDFIGRFFDVGVYGNWTFASRHVYAFEQPSGEKVKVKKSGLSYMSPYDYGLLARIGFGNFVLKSSYRFSDHFKSESGLEEFPRLYIGFEMGLHPF